MRPTCTHLALFCADIEKSVRFYARFVRLHEVHRRIDGGITVVWMGEEGRADEFVLVLLGIAHPAGEGEGPVAHLGYALASREEVDEVAREARNAGVETQDPIYAGPIVGYYTMLRDPDRNWIEFSHGQSLGPR